VVLLGAGAIAAHGFEELDAALRQSTPLWTAVTPVAPLVPQSVVAARIPPFSLSRIIRGVDARGLDNITRYLTAAAALALKDAGVRVTGSLRERAGLILGANRLPGDSADEFWDSIRARGFGKASAPAFARIVMNAAAGAVSRVLSLKGPLSLFASGPPGALISVIAAAEMLGRRADADLYVAGAADDLSPGILADHAFVHPEVAPCGEPFTVYGPGPERPVRGEGAACLVLARARYAEERGLCPLARLEGSGLAGPSGLTAAIKEALGRAGVPASAVDAVYGSADGRAASGAREIASLSAVLGPRLVEVPLFSPAPILGSSDCLAALSLAAAALALRSGSAHPMPAPSPSVGLNLSGASPRPVRRILVIAADELAGSAALLFARP
jgi:3-oxoacyl-(acyl-carrier-protein) synthase